MTDDATSDLSDLSDRLSTLEWDAQWMRFPLNPEALSTAPPSPADSAADNPDLVPPPDDSTLDVDPFAPLYAVGIGSVNDDGEMTPAYMIQISEPTEQATLDSLLEVCRALHIPPPSEYDIVNQLPTPWEPIVPARQERDLTIDELAGLADSGEDCSDE